MAKVLISIELERPDLDLACEKLNTTKDQIDEGFGLVCIDPQKNLYALMVEEEFADQPFSSPRIEPFH